MKYISIDTNSKSEDNKILISDFTVNYFNLKDGMEIYAYQDVDVWNAVVHKYTCEDKYEYWYVELCGLRETLDCDLEKWISINFENGICLGKELKTNPVAYRMRQLGYNSSEIDEICSVLVWQKR